MICPKCNANVPDGTAFCDQCGTSLQQQGQPMYGQQPNQPVQPAQPMYVQQQNIQTAQPMGWFKFLIYFALFAGAVVNVINAIQFFAGTQYGSGGTYVYLVFPSLRAIDIITAILMLGAAALAVVTRIQLAGYKKKGPTLLLAVYGLNALINIFYIIGVASSVGSLISASAYSSNVISVVVSIIMIFVNYIYFKKRSNMFVG